MHVVRPPVGLRPIRPAPLLRDFVSTYYLFHADLPHLADLMPAGLAQIRFMLRGRVTYRFGSGEEAVVSAPDASLFGPSFSATRFEANGPLLLFGVVLRPAGWAALVRADASRLADRMAPAADMLDMPLAGLCDSLRTMPDGAGQAGMADAVITRLLDGAAARPLGFARLVRRWLAGVGSPSVDRLVAAAGMSVRQVERLSRRTHGAPPKLVARKQRALRAAARLVAGKARWQDAAGDDFADQSHFIRELRQFTGHTPTQLRMVPGAITRLGLGPAGWRGG